MFKRWQNGHPDGVQDDVQPVTVIPWLGMGRSSDPIFWVKLFFLGQFHSGVITKANRSEWNRFSEETLIDHTINTLFLNHRPLSRAASHYKYSMFVCVAEYWHCFLRFRTFWVYKIEWFLFCVQFRLTRWPHDFKGFFWKSFPDWSIPVWEISNCVERTKFDIQYYSDFSWEASCPMEHAIRFFYDFTFAFNEESNLSLGWL